MNQTDIQRGPPSVSGNAAISILGKLFYLVSRLILPPLVLSHITLVEYGIWSAAFIIIMYIGLTDVGFSNVYVRYSARYYAQGNFNAINRLLSTGVVTLSIISVLVIGGVWLILPLILQFLMVDPDYWPVAKVLMMGATSMFVLDLSLGAYCYLLHGLQRFREEQKVAMTGYLLELLLIIIFLQMGLGVYALLLAFVLRYLWSLTAFMRLAHIYLPSLQIRLCHWDTSQLRHFLVFGTGVQISALLGTVLFSLDRLLAGAFLGPKGIAIFELAAKLPVAAVSVPSVISNVTMPAASAHSMHDNKVAISKLYLSASRAIGMLASFPLAFMALFSAEIVQTWLGSSDEFKWLPVIMTMTAIWSQIHIVTGPGSSIFRGIGQVHNEYVYHGLRIAGLLLTIPLLLSIYGTSPWVFAAGIMLGNIFSALCYLSINHRKLCTLDKSVMQDILLPGWLAYAVAGMIWILWDHFFSSITHRWTLVLTLAVSGLLYSTVLIGVLWRWVLSTSERQHLALMLQSALSRFYPQKVT